MAARLLTHNDLHTFRDGLDRTPLVHQIAHEIAQGGPPLVFGIHGDWGAGKTSFLCQLANELADACPCDPERRRAGRTLAIDNVFTVWFEAWRYQHEPAPVVALLQEMCRQLPRHQKVADVLKGWGAVLTEGFFAAIDELSFELQAAPGGIGPKAGIKFKNPLQRARDAAGAREQEQLSGRLTTDHLRDRLKEVIEKLLGSAPKGRVCVIIDDLDRCDPAAALRLLEGIKIYLSLPQCVFVLGVNLRQIQRAIAPLLPGARDRSDEAEQSAEAAEYLEKLCTFTWKLPFLTTTQRAALLLELLTEDPANIAAGSTPLPGTLCDALASTARDFDCLPANPRKIKALANTIRQLAVQAWGAHATSSQSLPIGAEEADALLIAASIYHSHPELLRYLQTYAGTWEELIKWINGKCALPAFSDLARLFEQLQRSAVARVVDESKPTLASTPLSPVFADPVHLGVFRIHRLLREATIPPRDSVTKEKLSRYLALAMSPDELALIAALPPVILP